MQKVLLSILFTLSISFLFGQSNFLRGKVVIAKGDTITGLINDRNWETNPTQLEFKTSTTDQPKVLGLNDIEAFQLSDGVWFEKHNVKFDNSREDPNYLSTSRDPEHYADGNFFLKIHLKGGLSLYSLVDENGRVHYFLHESGKNPVELLNRSFHSNVAGRPTVRTFEGWKQQLVILGLSCENISERIKSASYNRSSLEKIVLELNRCLGTPVMASAPQARQQQTRRKPQLGVAVQAYTLYSAYASGLAVVRTTHDGINFGAGVFAEFFLKGRSSIYNELKVKSMAEQYAGNWGTRIEMRTVRLVTAIRETLPGKKRAFFIDFGITNGIRKGKFSYVDPPAGSIFSDGDEEQKFETGVVVGLGAKVSLGKLKLSPRFTYEYETAVRVEKFDASRSLGLVIGIGL
ncbi:MAG TPA: hypothetical protein VGD40_20050 [Chryseosolibacter sp.]